MDVPPRRRRAPIERVREPFASTLFVVTLLATWLVPFVLLRRDAVIAGVVAVALMTFYAWCVSPRRGFGPLGLEVIEVTLFLQTVAFAVIAVVALVRRALA